MSAKPTPAPALKLWPLHQDGEFPGSYLSTEDGYEHWMVDSPYEAAAPTPFLQQTIEAQWPDICKVSKALKLEPPHIFFYRETARDRAVGLYFAGSTDDPCMALNVDTDWQKDPEQVLVTIVHELAHARLESVLGEDQLAGDKDATEEMVENFARNYYDLGLDFAMKEWRKGEAAALKAQENPPHPFAGTKVADRWGEPVVVYHGTLSKFNRDSLDVSKSAPNNDFGCGLYFTNTERDARMNYATDGAEARRKKERGLDVDTSAGEVLQAHLNLQNPVVIGGKGETRFLQADGSLPRAIQALHDAVYANEPEDPAGPGRGVRGGADYMRDKGFARASTYAKGYVGAREFTALVRCQMGLDTGKWGDPNQVNKKMEYLRQAFEAMGFDGIIDRTAGARFAERAKNSPMGNYAHLDKSVVHYIAFRADQVQILEPAPRLAPPRGEDIGLSQVLQPPVVADERKERPRAPGMEEPS